MISNSKRVLLLMSPATYRAGAFLQAAQRLHLEPVVGLDLPDTLSNYWHVPLGLDFQHPDQAIRSICTYAEHHPLRAILAVDDSATELAAYANEALGLPGNSPQSSEAARDKLLMRQLMSEGGVPCPNFHLFRFTADPQEIAQEVNYPCVLKPRRLSGSRGVIRVNNSSEFIAAWQRLHQILRNEGDSDQESSFLVEDFIPGQEVALEGLLTEGILKVLTIFDKPDPLDGPYFEETIYVTPSRLPLKVQQQIKDCVARASHAIGLCTGPIHAEVRVNEQGPWMLEIAGRSIGGLCSTILEFGSGICLEELILRHAIGEEVTTIEREHNAAAVMMIPIPGAGILKGIHGIEEAEAVPLITGVEITAKINNVLVPLPEGSSYLGFIFARGDTPEKVEIAIRAAYGHLRFDIRRELPLTAVGSRH